jgi:flagellum-specific peptidoglycan hydrolase FlgJ
MKQFNNHQNDEPMARVAMYKGGDLWLQFNFTPEGFVMVLGFVAVLIIGVAHALNQPEQIAAAPAAGPEKFEAVALAMTSMPAPAVNAATKSAPAITRRPVSVESKTHLLRAESDEDARNIRYIIRFQHVARAEHEKYGIPASVKMAQGILETAGGTSKLARELNNHFGIKCKERSCRPGHCANYTDDSHKDFFLKHQTAWESWRQHSLLLSNPDWRYAKYISQCGNDYKCWADGLQASGYATNKSYAAALKRIIERYDLHQLDKGKHFITSQK